jgi:hypothetical protein
MVRDMLADETGDEVVAMVVTPLHPQFDWMTGGSARRLQQVRFELAVEEFIGIALVDQ